MSKSNEALIEAYNRGYRVSECGNKLTTPDQVIGQVRTNKDGYPVLSIRIKNGDSFPVLWHRLQAYQKYKEKLFEKGIEVRHKNNIKSDCSHDNILIGTHGENMGDNPPEKRLEYSLLATSKIRKHNASSVKEFYSKCKSYAKTMEHFGISSKGTLHFILNEAKYS